MVAVYLIPTGLGVQVTMNAIVYLDLPETIVILTLMIVNLIHVLEVGVSMDLTTTPAAAILDMLEATVILIMMTAVLLLAFMGAARITQVRTDVLVILDTVGPIALLTLMNVNLHHAEMETV